VAFEQSIERMRALLAGGLALILVLSAGAAHAHVDAHGAESCAACVLRSADVPQDPTPDLAPAPRPEGAPAIAPGLPPVSGAPLGAVPGQSPPVPA
jgi:hypothetical protein